MTEQTSPPLQNTTWTLVQIKPGSNMITLNERLDKPRLQMKGNQVTGFTGCSPLKASVTVNGNNITFSNIDGGPTDQCNDHILGLRDDYTTLLSRASTYTIEGDTLTIQAVKSQLIFKAYGEKSTATTAAPANLSGEWHVSALTLNGKTVTIPNKASLNLRQTSSKLEFSGSVGCNQLQSSSNLNGNKVNFNGMTSTKMMCPPNQMQAEMALGQLLRGPLTITVSGNTQTWTGQNGKLVLTRRAETTSLSGPYTLISMNGKAPPQMNRAATIRFQHGKVSGSDGCNLYSADYQLAGQQITLTTPAMSTMMACPNNGEVPLPALLMKKPTFTLNGKTLTLKAGLEVWVFQAK